MPELPELPPLTVAIWIAVGFIAVGLLLCFRGFAAMRWILAIVGGFAGWQFGSLAATYIALDPDFDTALRWGVTVFATILFGSLAYAFFIGGILVSVGWLGYLVGDWLVTQLGWTGWLAIIVPIVLGLGLAVVAFITKLPRLILVVVTAVAGAAAITAGALALVESINLADLNAGTVPALFGYGILWHLVFLALIAAGFFVQLRTGGKQNDLRAIYS
ncbi:MAG: hypothetical protein LCH76_11830 [Actinobacteria bacterium]|nr:hypothetical protein [Actinomycetota bacterium]